MMSHLQEAVRALSTLRQTAITVLMFGDKKHHARCLDFISQVDVLVCDIARVADMLSEMVVQHLCGAVKFFPADRWDALLKDSHSFMAAQASFLERSGLLEDRSKEFLESIQIG